MEQKKKNIHLLGIGGTGMGALAGLLKEIGYHVTGSDNEIYSPMKEELERLEITPYKGYSEKNLDDRPDHVVIGNVITKINPEAIAVEKQGIPYLSMPQALARFFLKDRQTLVVTGTHGKTTVSTLLAWFLTAAQKDPGFFIGGIGKNFGRSAARGSGKYFVVEGDEYDTAYFDKGPKFLHYRPFGSILTSIEFDHADIYRSLHHVLEAFRKFVALMPHNGVLIANIDDANVKRVIAEAPCRVVTYGFSPEAHYAITHLSLTPEGSSCEITTKKEKISLHSPLAGRHNIVNTVAACALLHELGMSFDELQQGLSTFEGVKRRQEVVGNIKDITIIDDFAHHPTAISETIDAIKARYPKRRVWALFEPRSNTSCRNVFQHEFVEALAHADRVIIASPFKADKLPKEERLDAQKIADGLMNEKGIDAHYIPGGTEFILEYLIRNINVQDVILVMSNGGFDNIHHKIIEKLERRKLYEDHSQLKMSRIPKKKQ